MSGPLNVGFIGIGDQGAPMAVAIAEKFNLHVWARRDFSYESLEGTLFTRHESAVELATAVDVLCVCLRSDHDLLELLQGGVLDALPSGAILMNHATGDPGEARAFEETCKAKEIRFVDAPVSGGRPGAVARTLTCFVGTDAATLEKCGEILSTHSTHVVHMGGAGTGQASKLCNNALTVSNLRNVVEVFSIADAFGVSPASLQKAFSHSSGGSFILDALGTKVTPQIAAHIAKLNRTDVEEFAAAAKKLGLDVSAIEAWALGGAAGLERVIARLSERS
ncbi:NAD(P)-dependent oxidoreductase [Agrobacterium sp. DE0009]|uniref:NAD(P)-dependent oxidoreductase n=1 Tax=Agrobacterium sp. DE0009 TaxID=2587505 RepID=UPI0011A7D3CA|nr:NAD(P)-dependent oxidoreductase [Agrobacterium sp. DE0009]